MQFILLFLTAVIVFPILFVLLKKEIIRTGILIGTAIGFLIALFGLFIQNVFSPIYLIVAMVALVFASSILINKRNERNSAPGAMYKKDNTTEFQSIGLQSAYTAATTDDRIDTTIVENEEDLRKWRKE